MGVENLLHFLRPALKYAHISQYRGKVAAIDASSWLYKGCYSCAQDINTAVPTSDYLYFLQKMITMLNEYEVKPVLVFDGMKLKAKDRTAQMRKKLKTDNLKKALELRDQGKQVEADRYFKRSLKITKDMFYTTLDVLSQLKIEFIVAPYEADAEMAHLVKVGYCDFAITEDVIVESKTIERFGLLLMSSHHLQALNRWILPVFHQSYFNRELKLDYLRLSKQNRLEEIGEKAEDVRVFFSLSSENLIDCCIMSGCDYLPSIKGIGVKKATELLHKQGGLHYALLKLKGDGKMANNIPKEYETIVNTIRLIFKYQTVYDPFTKSFMHLNQEEFSEFAEKLLEIKEISDENKENLNISLAQVEALVGLNIEEEKVIPYSQGLLDVKTLEPRERKTHNFKKLFARFNKPAKATSQYTTPTVNKVSTINFGTQQNDARDHHQSESQDQFSPPEAPQREIIQFWDDPLSHEKPTTNQRQPNNEMDDLMDICQELFDEFGSISKKINDTENQEVEADDENRPPADPQQLETYAAGLTMGQTNLTQKRLSNPFSQIEQQTQQPTKLKNLAAIDQQHIIANDHRFPNESKSKMKTSFPPQERKNPRKSNSLTIKNYFSIKQADA